MPRTVPPHLPPSLPPVAGLANKLREVASPPPPQPTQCLGTSNNEAASHANNTQETLRTQDDTDPSTGTAAVSGEKDEAKTKAVSSSHSTLNIEVETNAASDDGDELGAETNATSDNIGGLDSENKISSALNIEAETSAASDDGGELGAETRTTFDNIGGLGNQAKTTIGGAAVAEVGGESAAWLSGINGSELFSQAESLFSSPIEPISQAKTSWRPPADHQRSAGASKHGILSSQARGLQEAEQRYRQLLIQHRALINRIVGELKNILEYNRRPRYVGPFRSGRLDMRRYLQSQLRVAQGAWPQDKLFLKRMQPMERNIEVVFSLDTSGSMAGSKMDVAEQALVVLVEALIELKIRFCVITFDSYPKIIKNIEDEHPQEGALLNLICIGGGTDDHEALALATQVLASSKAQKRLVFFLTDGGGISPGELHSKIIHLENDVPEITVLGIGLGTGCYDVPISYPHALMVPELGDLPQKIAETLQRFIED